MAEHLTLDLRKHDILSMVRKIKDFSGNAIGLTTCHGGFERSDWVAKWLYCRNLVIPSRYNLNNCGVVGFSYNNLDLVHDFTGIGLIVFCIDFDTQNINFEKMVHDRIDTVPKHLTFCGSWDNYRVIEGLVS